MAWRRSYLVRSLTSFGGSLVLGDAMSSVTVLKVEEQELQIVARDYGPLWPISVHALDQKNIIGSNVRNFVWSYEVQSHGQLNSGRYEYLHVLIRNKHYPSRSELHRNLSRRRYDHKVHIQ
jgi:hypothetical protein